MSQELTPDQQLIADTTNFARTLLSAGCSPEFICEQAFNYAINAQVQKHRLELAMMCANGEDYSIDRENTGYMDIAAQVLVQVVTAIGIHPNQVKSEHPYHDHHMIERHS